MLPLMPPSPDNSDMFVTSLFRRGDNYALARPKGFEPLTS